MEPAQTVAGFATGFLVGLTGVGGGALMTPLLLLVFNVAPMAAVGTDLWFAATTKLAATRVHTSYGLIDRQVLMRLWRGSLPAAGLTLLWMQWQAATSGMVVTLKAAIALAVILTAVGMFFQKPLHALGRRFRTTEAEHFQALQGPLTTAAGALLGALVTLTSVGAGALGAVFLAYLYPLRLTPPRLIATDIAHAIPLALFAAVGHLFIGSVNFPMLGNLLLGSIPGVICGALLSARLPHGILRTVLSIVLLLIGTKLVWSL